jgi:hypothetical protein
VSESKDRLKKQKQRQNKTKKTMTAMNTQESLGDYVKRRRWSKWRCLSKKVK